MRCKLFTADLKLIQNYTRGEFQGLMNHLLSYHCKSLGIKDKFIQYQLDPFEKDKGIDLLIEDYNDTDPTGFIPSRNTIWQYKSGDTASNKETAQDQLKNELKKEKVKEYISKGYTYVYCLNNSIISAEREKLKDAFVEYFEKNHKEAKVQRNQIEIHFPNQIQERINDYPNIIRHYNLFINNPSNSLMRLMRVPLETLSSEYSLRNSFIETDDIKQVIKRIQEHFESDTIDNVLYICGLTGIGKTKIVLEACKKITRELDLFKTVIYLDQYYNNSKEYRQILFEIRETRASYIIFDDVYFSDLDKLESAVRNNPNIRVIAIVNASKNDKISGNNIYLNKPEDNDLLRKYIDDISNNKLPRDTVNKIIQICNNDFKFAYSLTDCTVKNGYRFDINDVNSFAEDVLNRYFEVIKKCNDFSCTADFKEIYQVLCCFNNIGIERKYETELNIVMANFGYPDRNIRIDKVIKRSTEYGLGIKHDCLFEPIPRGLALYMFNKLYELNPINIKERFRKILTDDRLPDHRLRKQLIARIDDLEEALKIELVEVVESFFRSELRCGTLSCIINRSYADTLSSWIIFNQQRGLKLLHELVTNSEKEIIKNFSEYNGRREIVWLLEDLLCFQDNFYICEEILFHLALFENERCSNNSLGIWKSMFWIWFSNSDIPFIDRFNVYLKRLEIATLETIDMIIGVSKEIVKHPITGKTLPPTYIGGRKTPEEWMPKTYAEIYSLEAHASISILKTIANLEIPVRLKAIEYITKHIYYFINQIEIITDSLELAFAEIIQNKVIYSDYLKKLYNKLNQSLSYLKKHKPDNINIPDLFKILVSIQPESIIDKLLNWVSLDYYDLKKVLDLHSDETDEEDKPLEYIARFFFEDPDLLYKLEEAFSKDFDHNVKLHLAYTLGKIDDKADIFKDYITDWVEKGKCSEFVARYILSSIHNKNSSAEFWDELVDNEIDKNVLNNLIVSSKGIITQKSFNRIMNYIIKVENKDAINILINLSHNGGWDFLSSYDKCRMIKVIKQLKVSLPVEALNLMFSFIFAWFYYKDDNIDNQLANELYFLFGESETEYYSSGRDDDFVLFCESMFKYYPIEVISIIINKVIISNSYYDEVEPLPEYLSKLIKKYPDLIFQYLVKAIQSIANRPSIFIKFKGLFQSIPQERLKDLLEKYVTSEEVAEWLAYSCELPYLKPDNSIEVPEMTLWVLNKFKDSELVFSKFCSSEFSGFSSWSFKMDNLSEFEEKFKDLLNHECKWLREWYKWRIEFFKNEIKKTKDREEFEKNY